MRFSLILWICAFAFIAQIEGKHVKCNYQRICYKRGGCVDRCIPVNRGHRDVSDSVKSEEHQGFEEETDTKDVEEFVRSIEDDEEEEARDIDYAEVRSTDEEIENEESLKDDNEEVIRNVDDVNELEARNVDDYDDDVDEEARGIDDDFEEARNIHENFEEVVRSADEDFDEEEARSVDEDDFTKEARDIDDDFEME